MALRIGKQADSETRAGKAALLAQLSGPVRHFLHTEAGSAGLLRVWNTLSSQMERFIIQSHVDVYIDFVEIGTRHYPIVEALRSHDADAASRAVQEHIMLIWSEILP